MRLIGKASRKVLMVAAILGLRVVVGALGDYVDGES